MFSLSSLLESRNCVLHLRTMLDWQRIQKKVFNKLRLDALSIPNYVLKKGPTHGARHGKTEEQKRVPYGLECVEEMLQECRLSRWTFYRFTIDFSEIQLIVNHNSQPDGQNKNAKSGMNLHKKTIHIVSLQRKRKDTKDNGILPWTKQAQMGLWNFDLIFRAAVLLKNRLHHESGEQIEEPIHPDQYRRWPPSSSTSWWDKSEWNCKWAHKIFELIRILFVTVGFVYSR